MNALRIMQRGPLPAHILALGHLRSGDMNKTEAAYHAHLSLRLAAREIQWFRFEPMKLRLADRTFYEFDFGVVAADGVYECHETKGGPWLDDARVKIKVAAELHPFRFFGVRRSKGGWEVEAF